MIVRNEAHVIANGLKSVKGIIDYWVIVDTGSNDGTQQLVKEVMKDIPGELHERPWINFAHNRNEALQLAKDKADYILFLDADDSLVFLEDFTLPEPKCDAYEIKWIHGSDLTYFKPQIIKACLPWHWQGVIHEYLTCAQSYSSMRLNTVEYLFGGKGARSQDPEKYIKAARILQQALIDEPDNARYVFYLAESLKDAIRYEEAIVQYERRAAMGGWDQEVYWSLLQVGLLKEHLGRPIEEVLACYNLAHRARPCRSEAVYCLAQIYNKQQNFPLAYACIKGWQAVADQAENDILFKMEWIEKWGLPVQLSIAAYYLGKADECKRLCDDLLKQEKLPVEYRQQMLVNRALLQQNLSLDSQDVGSLYRLCTHYRERQLYQLAYPPIKKAFELCSPCREPRILWELAIAAFNIGNFQEAVEVGNHLRLLNLLGERDLFFFNRSYRYFISGIHSFAHARAHWGLAPWEKGESSAPPKETFKAPAKGRHHLHIVTMASDNTPSLQQLKDSCTYFGHRLDVVGMGEPFSFGKKLRDYKKYIDSLPDGDVVLCVDGYDVLVLADEKTLMERFLSLHAPVVCCTETNCHPYAHLAPHYPSTDSRFKYLNSGSYIGYAGALKKIFASFDDLADEVDDQGILSLYYLYFKDSICLDHEAKLFLTLLDVSAQDIEFHKERKSITYSPYATSPLVVHGNSSGKQLYQEIYDRLFKKI